MGSLQYLDNSNQNYELPQAVLMSIHEQHATMNQNGFLLNSLPVQGPLHHHSYSQQSCGFCEAPNMGLPSSMQLQVAGTMSCTLGASIGAPSQQLMLPGTSSFSPILNNADNGNIAVDCAGAYSSDVLNNNVRGQSVSPTPIWGITGSHEPARGFSLESSNLQQSLYSVPPQNVGETAASIHQYSTNAGFGCQNLLPLGSDQGFMSGPAYSTALLDGPHLVQMNADRHQAAVYQNSSGQAASLSPVYYPANMPQAEQPVWKEGGVVGQPACCASVELYPSQGYGGGHLAAATKQKQPAKAPNKRKKKAAPAKQRQGSRKQTCKKSCKRGHLLREAQIADALSLLAAADNASITTTVQSPWWQGPANETPLYSSSQPHAAAQLSLVAHDAHNPSGSGYMPSFDLVQSFIESGAAAQHNSSFGPLPSADVAATHLSQYSFPPCTTFLDCKTCADSFTPTDVQQLQDSSYPVTQQQQAAVLYWQQTAAQAPLRPASPCLGGYDTSACLINRPAQPVINLDACYQGTVDALQPNVQGGNTAAVADGLPASDILQEADMLNLPSLDAPCDVDAGLLPIRSIHAAWDGGHKIMRRLVEWTDCPPYQSAQYSVSSTPSNVPVNTYNVQSAATATVCISLNDAASVDIGWSEGSACIRHHDGLSSNNSSDFDMILDFLIDPEDVLGAAVSSTASAGVCQQQQFRHADQPGGVPESASTESSDADELVALDVWCLSDSVGC